MAVNLKKGQRVSLTKEDNNLSKIMVGLGWDPVKNSGGKGLFGGLFGSKGQDIDCDSSIFMLDENNKIKNNKNVVYFGNLNSQCGSVKHMGDNLTGNGDGDDEQVMVELSRVPEHIHKLVFVVNIYDCLKRKQHFGMIQNAFIRIVNMSDSKEMVRFNLTDNYDGKSSLFVGEIYRSGNEWKFAATGEGDTATGLNEMMKRYR